MKTEDTSSSAENEDSRQRPRLISIRAKIMGSFIVVFLIPVMAMMFLLSRRMPDSFDELARVRVFSALEGIRGDFDSLRLGLENRVESIASDRSVIDASLNMAKKGIYSERIATIRDTTGLDILKVVDHNMILLADGADKAKFNVSMVGDPNIRSALSNGQSHTVISKNIVDGEEKISIVIYQPVWYHGDPIAVLIAGNYIEEDFVTRLEKLTTGTVALFVGDKPTICSKEVPPADCLPISGTFLRDLESNPNMLRQIGSGESDYMAGGLPIVDPRSRTVAGFFVFGISRDEVKRIIGRTKYDMIYVALMGLIISIVLAVIISVSITRPISRLVSFTRQIGRGEFENASIQVNSRDEIGLLADTMNRMVKDLDEYSEKLAYSERLAAWSEIARRMAHEIKNPLSPIQMSMENLKATFTEDKATFNKYFPESADTVLEEVDKLRKLANEFSEFARLPKPVFEEVDIAEMLGNLVAFNSNYRKDIDFRLKTDDPEVVIKADRDQMNRVFTNLIKNAMEAMPDGGELDVSIHIRQDEIFIMVKDSGEGIEEEKLNEIFKPYFSSKEGGTGLGLSIVRRIIRDHDASIDVASTRGEGTTFTIVFRKTK